MTEPTESIPEDDWDQPGEIPDLDATFTRCDLELAQAVAVERESIATWLESVVNDECGPMFHYGNDGQILTLRLHIPREQIACGHSLLAAIRAGVHNEGGV